MGERGSDDLHLLPTFVTAPDGELRPNPEAARLDARNARDPGWRGRPRHAPAHARAGSRPPSCLGRGAMLPAIVFVFSRKGVRPGGRAVPRRRAAPHRAGGARPHPRHRRGQDRGPRRRRPRRARATTSGSPGSRPGFAAHHAGMVPPMKEAVEEAFAAGLVKVVFATETLALGINMPARSVVIEKLSKFTGERHEFLTPGEYTQLTGRAGRRGIDDVGLRGRVLEPVRAVRPGGVAGVAPQRRARVVVPPDVQHGRQPRAPLHRSSRPTTCSTCRSRSSTPTATSSRSSASSSAPATQLARQRDAARRRPRATVQRVPRARRRARRRSAATAGGGRRIAEAHGGAAARRRASSCAAGAGGSWCSTTSTGVAAAAGWSRSRPARDVVRLGPQDFDAPPRRAATIDLPTPFAPRNPAFRRQAAERLRRAKLRDDGGRSRRDERRLAELEDAARRAPAGRRPAARAEAAGRGGASSASSATSQRTERRVRGRSESLARQFDRVLPRARGVGLRRRLAAHRRRASSWPASTPRPTCSLAEALREGLLDGLRPPSSPRSCRASPTSGAGPRASTRCRRRAGRPRRWRSAPRAVERIAQDLRANEDDAGLPETRLPDPGFTPYAHDWAAGDSLADVLDDDEMTGGDFVRHVKQCIDLLRQVGDVAPDPETARRAPARRPTRATGAWSRRRASRPPT